MAKQLQRKRAPKRNGIAVPSLPEIYAMPASAKLRATIMMQLAALRGDGIGLLVDDIGQSWRADDGWRLVESNIARWHRENVALARRAIADDDEALMTLLRRDPRYLGTELVAAKAFLWRLQILYGLSHVLRDAERAVGARGQAAAKKRDELAAAIGFTTGRGNKKFINYTQLLVEFEGALELGDEIVDMFAKHVTDSQIARRTKLPPSLISEIAVLKKGARNARAELITIYRLGGHFNVKQLQRLVSRARKIVELEE